jgi:DNA-binding beta-propeller fold protein YncE
LNPRLPLLALAALLAACSGPIERSIAEENLRPGTSHFGLRDDQPHDRVEAYTDRLSVTAGERVTVHAAIHAPAHPQDQEVQGTFTWDLFRLGSYRGHGGRHVGSGGPVTVGPQPRCPLEPATGRVACAWAPTFTLETRGLLRGVYVLRLSAADGSDSYLPLVVRDGARAEVAMIVPTSTWLAYSMWGGAGLYGDRTGKTRFGVAAHVSYDRPFEFGGPGDLMLHDRHLVQWLEAASVDVAYYTSEDVDRDPSLLSQARAVIFSAHDEYWTRRQRDGAEAALAGGTSLLLLGANAGYWQTRLEPAPDGRERRELVCFKGNAPAFDPVGPASPDLTVRFREVGRPEGSLFGVQYEDGWAYTSYPLQIAAPGHWALAGSGLAAGDPLWAAGGRETDQVYEGPGRPAGVTPLGEAQFLGALGTPGRGQMVIREQGQALVFASGGIGFVRALGAPGIGQPGASRILANVLSRALGRPLPLPGPAGHLAQSVHGAWASSVRHFAGTPGARGDADGPPGTGKLDAPLAVAALPGGGLVVADAASGKLRRVSAEGVLSTIPLDPPPGRVLGLSADAVGNVYYSELNGHVVVKLDPAGGRALFAGVRGSNGAGVPGDHDGPAAEASFARPAGLALSRDGKGLYVVELGGGRLRRIALDVPGNPVTTLARGLGSPTSAAELTTGEVMVWDQEQFRLFSVEPMHPLGPRRDASRDGTAEPQPRVVMAGEGMVDDLAWHSRMRALFGLLAMPDGSLLVADGGNGRIRRLADGAMQTLAGTGRAGSRDGTGAQAELTAPSGLAVGTDGRVYVTEAGAGVIRVIEP